MKSVLRIVGGLFALLLVIIGGLLIGARFADGPIAIAVPRDAGLKPLVGFRAS